MKAILTKITICFEVGRENNKKLIRETNHAWLHNFAWGHLTENGNFRHHGKLIIHGYIMLHGGDLNRNEKIQRQIIHLISWDRRINVISCWLLKYLLHFSDPFLPPQVGRHREWDSEARNGDWNAPHGPGGGQESVHLDFPRDAGFSHCCFQQLNELIRI